MSSPNGGGLVSPAGGKIPLVSEDVSGSPETGVNKRNSVAERLALFQKNNVSCPFNIVYYF